MRYRQSFFSLLFVLVALLSSFAFQADSPKKSTGTKGDSDKPPTVAPKKQESKKEVSAAGAKDEKKPDAAKKAEDDNGTLNGVTVGDVDRAARQQFDLPGNLKGAVVTDVAPDSPAAEAGLRPGDVILEINRKPVHNAEEAVKLTEKTDTKTSLLRVWRNGGSQFVVVDESRSG